MDVVGLGCHIVVLIPSL